MNARTGVDRRVVVIYEGRIMDIVARQVATPERLGLLMAGVSEQIVEA